MRNKHLFIWVLALWVITAALLFADDAPAYDTDLLNNKFLLENQRLLKLAEDSLAKGSYEDAAKYAAQADQFAEQSDNYVALQKKIKDANDAIGTAQDRMNWAQKVGAHKRYAEIYNEADGAFTQAVNFRSGEKWDDATASAKRVVTILAQLPDEIPLPAQYKVRVWTQYKDSLWTIAAKPEVYNDPMQWRRLYNANRSKLPKPENPDLIEPGMILDIPSINDEYRFGLLEE